VLKEMHAKGNAEKELSDQKVANAKLLTEYSAAVERYTLDAAAAAVEAVAAAKAREEAVKVAAATSASTMSRTVEELKYRHHAAIHAMVSRSISRVHGLDPTMYVYICYISPICRFTHLVIY
jgi:hypothetical protein